MKKFHSKKKYQVKYKIFLIMVAIIFFTWQIINYVGNRVSPKLINIIKDNINIFNNNLIMDYVDTGSFIEDSLDNIINLVKNNNNEIIAVDYNMKTSYKLLKQITNTLKSGSEERKKIDFQDYQEKTGGMVLNYPIGIGSDNIYLNNLGYKIPVRIELSNSLITSLKTKVTNYGINNALVEMYLNVSIKSKVIIPLIAEDINNNYSILIGAKLIMGSVPSYLNGMIEKTSSYES